jgi:hypothetical protein
MEPLVLTDKSVFPNDELVFSHLGQNSQYWQKLLHAVRTRYPDVQEIWNYYNDGKRWLFRTMQKKKTLFWIGVFDGGFRITFYFGDKAASIIEGSDLPEILKDEFRNGKRFGKIRAISLRVEGPDDIAHAIRLTELKEKIK